MNKAQIAPVVVSLFAGLLLGLLMSDLPSVTAPARSEGYKQGFRNGADHAKKTYEKKLLAVSEFCGGRNE